MSTFDQYADGPGQIRKEGQEITLKLDRTGPTTGRISWNIPSPAAGCTAETQAYCGIVITLDTAPANRSTTPVNETEYASDPTADADLHAGNKIGTALVVGAFYEGVKKGLGEELTTFVDVSGMDANTVYYVAGYAVDCQLRYHQEGVHAYSLDLGNDGTPDSSGTVTVEFDPAVAGTDGTGLTLGQDYSMQLEVDGQTYTITVNGSDAQTYDDLVTAINDQIELLTPAPQSLVAPDTGSYYYKDGKLYQWDGNQYVEIPVLNEPSDPTTLAVGTYWLDTDTSVLSRWDGTVWNTVPETNIIRYKEDLTDFNNLDATDYWYRPEVTGSPTVPSAAFGWCGNVWCQKTLYDQTQDPQIGTEMNCGSYWYNPDDMLLRNWDEANGIWVEVDALYWSENPVSLSTGTYWFNDEDETLWQHETPVAGMWNPIGKSYIDFELSVAHQSSDLGLADGTYTEQITIAGQVIDIEVNVCNATDGRFDKVFEAINAQLGGLAEIGFRGAEPSLFVRLISANAADPVITAGGTLFVALTNYLATEAIVTSDPLTVGTEPTSPVANQYWVNEDGDVFQRDAGNTTWTPLCSITFGTDPTDVTSCELWWDSDSDILNIWDPITSMWVPVLNFYQTTADPSAMNVIEQDSIWYNNGTMSVWDGTQWVEVDYVSFPSDPMEPADGDVWQDTANGLWYVWSGSPADWILFNPVDSPDNPSQATLPVGTFWYNTTTGALSMWNGTNWVNVMFTTEPVTPEEGELWYDLSTNTLMEWDGTMWVPGTPIATVVLSTEGTIVFTSSSEGNGSLIDIGRGTIENEIFYSMTPIPEISCPQAGTDGLSGVPSYNELDVGTDGTADERRKMVDEIRELLGYPVVEVELTKAQMDKAISVALKELRRNSAAAYRRGFMKLNVSHGKQIYKLTKPTAEYDSEGTGYELADGQYGHDKIVQVMGCFRITSAFLTSAHGSGVFGQVVLQHLYNMGTFDLLSFHLVSEYIEQLEHLFASRLTFNWNETARSLTLHQSFAYPEQILMDVAVERTEQDLLTDRFTGRWLERYALAESKKMLAQIRGKYASLPGAGGGVSLNASDLAQEARDEQEMLLKEIEDYVVNNVEEYGMHSEFIIG